MLNKYLDRLERLTVEAREASLDQFQGPGGQKAKFDDPIWYHIDPNTGRRTRYLCGVHGVKGRSTTDNVALETLPPPYDHLIKVWIIDTVNLSISASEKKARTSIARKLLSLMDGDLYAQTESKIQSLSLGARFADRLRPFLRFCSDNGLMRKLELTAHNGRDRTGHATLDSNFEKLPDIKTVVALGVIFSSIFEHVDASGTLRSGKIINMRDALVVTYSLLSLASPNRASAEISVLPKQRLNSYSESKGELVYYLDWIGSKGYGSNKNHMLAALVEPITKAINFFHEACEPARILCRFYENPNQSLSAILGGFEISPKLKININLDLNPTIFTLGYALGFYGVYDCVSVLKEDANLADIYCNQRFKFFEKRPIYSLCAQDQLSISQHAGCKYSSLPYLFGYANVPNFFSDKITITVGEVQEWWISFYKESILPDFPLSYSSGESNIFLKDSLFCFLGSWFYGENKGRGGVKGGKIFQKTNYAIVPLAALGNSVSRELMGCHRGGTTFFESYGFSSELGLRIHSLRHLTNTLADMSSIPVEIITAWSGRKDAEQTHTYIHTSHDEKVSRVSAIINPPNIDRRDIRVVSQANLMQVTNLPASITSTGLCTQNLNVTPCNYLNDFVSQCFMCTETCHIAGDEKTITLLEKDYSFQALRLERVASDPRLPTSQAMRSWYVIHSRNTHVLSSLIDLMKDSLKGTIIRYSSANGEFDLIDLNTKNIKKVICALPNSELHLKKIIEDQAAGVTSITNKQLRSILSTFGLSDEEV